jgi:hypothetical protein
MNIQSQKLMSERFQTDICAKSSRFPLSEICVTANILSKVEPEDIMSALGRHMKADWGELDKDGRTENEQRLNNGGPLASIFRSARGVEFYILTEADRSVTTILLPEEY